MARLKSCTWLFLLILILAILSVLCYIKLTEWSVSRTGESLFHISDTRAPNKDRGNISAETVFNLFQLNYNVLLSSIRKPVYQPVGYRTWNESLMTSSSTHQSRQVKKVLLWTTFFGVKQWMPKVLCLGELNYCETSTDHSDLLQSDAVVFHPMNLWSLPKQRLTSQRWVYFQQESPNMPFWMNVEEYNDVFNWTATYRLDSDFPAMYFETKPKTRPMSTDDYKKMFEKLYKKKTRLVAVAISNCDTFHTKRLQFIEKLKNYIQVDFYGNCGDMKCQRFDSECEKKLSTYKFYLSFENSNCRDYITEKVANTLHTNQAVPIVMGGAHPSDYEKTLPHMSYIHYQGFRSVKELADYIQFLDKHPQYYEKYHRWRRSQDCVGLLGYTFGCEMCRGLHNTSLPSKVYNDFKQWYDQDICIQSWALKDSRWYTLTAAIFSLLLIFLTMIYIWLKYCKHA